MPQPTLRSDSSQGVRLWPGTRGRPFDEERHSPRDIEIPWARADKGGWTWCGEQMGFSIMSNSS